jgi:drug/metabolite transporter (DMT)-like permease
VNSPRRASRLALAAAMASIYAVWGTTYLAIRVAVETMPPFLLAAIIYIIAGPVLVALVVARSGLAEGIPPARQWLSALLIGIGLITFGNGALMWGEQYVPSGVAAIVVATVPAWLALFARVVLRERLHPLAIFGLGLGFAGLAILVAPSAGRLGALAGLAAVLLTAIGWAAASVYSRIAPLPGSPFLAAGMQMTCGGIFTLGVALIAGDVQRFHLGHVATQAWIAFAYLLVVGAIFAIGVFQWLVRHASFALVGTYAYVNPIVAVVLGALLLGEQVSARTVIACSVTVLGVALILAAQTMGRKSEGVPAADEHPVAETTEGV